MEKTKKLKRKPVATIFDIHGDKITEAYDRAVRDAMIKHKKLGNYIVVERDGDIVKLQGEEIEELLKQ